MSTLSSRVRNASAALRRYGPRRYSLRLAQRGSKMVYMRHAATVFRCDLAAPVKALAAKVPLQIEALSRDEHDVLYDFLSEHVRKDIIDWRLGEGWMPMVGFYQDKPIGMSWYSTQPPYLAGLGLYLNYGGGSGYIEGTITDERLRGMGVAPAIRSQICARLRELGCKQVFVCAGDDNEASHAVARRCGFEPYEAITLTRFLGLRRYERHLL
ncbi:MAG: GNAT family N-acetyltransferase [Gammaproteobacteria bacterium]